MGVSKRDEQLAFCRAQLEAAAAEITMSRRRPFRLLKRLVVFRILDALSQDWMPISTRARKRFRNSLLKRDPNRPVVLLGQTVGTSSQSEAIEAQNLAALLSGLPSSKRKRVLVFSHEASRTGAPVLSLNIIDELSKQYDVISVNLLGGELSYAFKEKCILNIDLYRTSMTHAQIEQRTLAIATAVKPEYAVVNSVVCYQVMSALEKAAVPSVALIHEFAVDIPVHPYFAEVVDKASRVVFSTEVTLKALLLKEHMCRPLKVSVMPQGQSLAPAIADDNNALLHEDAMIRRVFPSLEEEIVVVGVGSVSFRKGVDIFLEVAKSVRSLNPKKHYRFVWVGDGFDTSHNEYSRFLRDQIQRSGVGDIVHFLPAVSSVEKVYAAADALVLTSRLDPLPNVAIDVIAKSKPVFCFDKTTGFAEIMRTAGFSSCIADYLSPSDMAEKIAQALPDKRAASELGSEQSMKIASLFNMKDYVAKIDTLGISAQGDKAVLEDNIRLIMDRNVFQRDFYEPIPSDRTDVEVIKDYIARCKSGRIARRGVPGFHPFLYAELNRLPNGQDPLAHYLTSGMPSGPWKCDVIRETSAAIASQAHTLRSALHIHAYYVDALEDMLSRIEMNSNRPDLFISTCDGGTSAVEAALKGYSGNVKSIRELPNVGRDIAPLLTEFVGEISNYDIIGHVHTKKSLHVGNRSMIDRWCEFVLGNMLGLPGELGMIDRVLGAYAADEDLTLVFPEDPHIMGWTENEEISAKLAKGLGMNALPENFNFPIGSMFWMRSGLFSRFCNLNLKWSDYPAEPLPIDGTILHALERLFGALPQAEGMKIAVTNINGLTR